MKRDHQWKKDNFCFETLVNSKNVITCSTENCKLLIAHQSYSEIQEKFPREATQLHLPPPPHPRLTPQRFSSLPRANGACACSGCLVCALTRLGGPECLHGEKLIQLRRRRVTLLAVQTFCFSCSWFDKFCTEI